MTRTEQNYKTATIANYIKKRALRESRNFPEKNRGTFVANRVTYLWELYDRGGESLLIETRYQIEN